MTALKNAYEKRRFETADWIAGFDTRLSELFAGVSTILAAFTVMTFFDGHSLAPFLETALWRMDSTRSAPLWLSALLLSGLFLLFALAIGTHRDTYLLRCIAAFSNAAVMTAIIASLLRGPQPMIVALVFLTSAIRVMFCGCALYLQHCERIANQKDINASASN